MSSECHRTKCQYYCVNTHTCDYYLITKQRRGDKGGKDCTHYDVGNGKISLLKQGTRSRFSSAEAKLLYLKGLSDAKTAEVLGVSKNAIYRWRTEAGLKANRPKPGQRVDRAKMMELWREGLSDAEISDRLHCSRAMLYQWRKANGLKANRKAQ